MKSIDDNTKNKILECAERLFIEKGFNLTSTTAIAKAAGCTQALIHYYFRTKENLFQTIFSKKLTLFIDTVAMTEDESLPFTEMLELRINRLFDLLVENPKLPVLMFNEFIVNQNQRDTMQRLFLTSCSESMHKLGKKLTEQVALGKIRETTVSDLTLNIFSLVVSFFVYLPFLEETGVVTDDNRREFLEHRKKEIIATVIKSL